MFEGRREASDGPTPNESYLEALVREWEGYLRNGKQDRAAQVEAEITRCLPDDAARERFARLLGRDGSQYSEGVGVELVAVEAPADGVTVTELAADPDGDSVEVPGEPVGDPLTDPLGDDEETVVDAAGTSPKAKAKR